MNNDLPPLEKILQIIEDIYNGQIPFNKLIGIKTTKLTTEFAEMKFRMTPELVGNTTQGILHGGVISAALDAAAGIAIIAKSLEKLQGMSREEIEKKIRKIGTIDIRIDYLLPGKGEEFTATSRTVRHGHKVAVTKMELHNEKGHLIATGTATYIVG